MQWLLAQEEQLDTARKEEKKMEELRKIQRDQLLKQNEMQLKIKKDSIINKTQNNIVEVKKVGINILYYLCNLWINSIRDVLSLRESFFKTFKTITRWKRRKTVKGDR